MSALTRARSDARTDGLGAALRQPRYEVLPLASAEDEVTANAPAHATITITASARRGIEPTIELAERLVRHGFRVVPHLSARLVSDDVELKEIIDRVDGLGVREVFVIAGDPERPLGRYPDALSLLRAMAELGHPFTEVGIAGYPETHPKITDDLAVQAMWDKRQFATYVVSQMCFDAGAVSRWVHRLRQRGVRLPVYAGVPGPASTTKLLRLSATIGVGDSTKFLSAHGAGMMRLGRPGKYTPDRLLDRLERKAHPDARLSGLHFYTFNDVAATELWRQRRLAKAEWTGPAEQGRRKSYATFAS